MGTQNQDRNPLEHMMFKGHLQITIRVIAITVGIMAILAGGGYLLDKQLDTFPIIFIIGLVIAFPLIQLIIYKKFTKLTKEISKDDHSS